MCFFAIIFNNSNFCHIRLIFLSAHFAYLIFFIIPKSNPFQNNIQHTIPTQKCTRAKINVFINVPNLS